MDTSANAHTRLLACDRHQSVLHRSTAAGRASTVYCAYGYHRPSARSGMPAFNGELPDPVTGHYLLGNGYRAYNPVLMRFNSPDSWSPFGRGGLNPYAYCQGDPVNRRDPTGHFSWADGVGVALGALGLGMSVASFGVATPLAMFAFVTGAAAEAVGAASMANNKAEGGNSLMWVAVGLGALSSVVAVGGLFNKLKDVGDTARKALVPNTKLPAPALSAPRAHISQALQTIEQPASFTRALGATNQSLGSHGDNHLTLAHAQKYVGLANAVEAGKVSNTTAHLKAAIAWARAGGSSGLVGAVFNSLAAMGTESIDHSLMKKGLALRRSST